MDTGSCLNEAPPLRMLVVLEFRQAIQAAQVRLLQHQFSSVIHFHLFNVSMLLPRAVNENRYYMEMILVGWNEHYAVYGIWDWWIPARLNAFYANSSAQTGIQEYKIGESCKLRSVSKSLSTSSHHGSHLNPPFHPFVCTKSTLESKYFTMSAERMWDHRRYKIEESTAQNGGKRTVFIEHMAPGTSVPPHVHYRFSETFDLIQGSMKVYTCDKPDVDLLAKNPQTVEIGKLATVEAGTYHQFVAGDEPTILRAIVTPGDADFERLVNIMAGLANDGELAQYDDSVALLSIAMELADAHVFGPTKAVLDKANLEQADEIRALKEELLAKYADGRSGASLPN